jgi:hypothetical protein
VKKLVYGVLLYLILQTISVTHGMKLRLLG